jgi:hypothetical protein
MRESSGVRERATGVVGLVEDRAGAVREALAAPERSTRTAVLLGWVLAGGFAVCFATGLYSHLLQNPVPGLVLPTRPVELYQWTQGAHVIAGTALIPLVLAKLWVVYPRLFVWPPLRSWRDAIERAGIAVLVGATLAQLAMGLLNTFQWYPWPFSFRTVHFGLSFVIVGAVLFHLAMKLPLIVRTTKGES